MVPRMRPHRRPGAPVALLAVLALTLILAACGAGSIFQNVGSNLEGGEPPPAAASSAPEPAGGGGDGEGRPPPFADLADRKIVKTGEVTLEVESVAAAVGEVRVMALALGGYVGGSQAGDDGDAATLTLRIPAERFEDALDRLHDMDGTVRAEATREEDVTSSIVDLEARIRNLEASEAQYRSLVERAELVEDILAVQSRLDTVRGEIEQLKAQLTQLDGLATLSTMTVTLVPHSTSVESATQGWNPQGTFDKALAALVGFGQGAADLLIWLAIVGLPLVVLGAIIAFVALRLLPGLRRRTDAPPAEAASE